MSNLDSCWGGSRTTGLVSTSRFRLEAARRKPIAHTWVCVLDNGGLPGMESAFCKVLSLRLVKHFKVEQIFAG